MPQHGADFTTEKFVDAVLALGHGRVVGKYKSKVLFDLLEGIALDDIAFEVFIEIAEANAAFEADLDFFHFLLEAT
jgi:hypothetical protein